MEKRSRLRLVERRDRLENIEFLGNRRSRVLELFLWKSDRLQQIASEARKPWVIDFQIDGSYQFSIFDIL
jgi:hypothetical protein